MAETNSVARSLHDVGLAAWFGGSLMGAIGLNGASEEVPDRKDRVRVANAGWARWTPASAAAIGVHLLGGAQIWRANRGRLAAQKGVGSAASIKLGLTAAALGVTAYSRSLGQKLMDAEADAAQSSPNPDQGLEAESGVQPAATTPEDVAKVQRQLQVAQWLVPALTGGILVLNARQGEQQRPQEILRGVLGRLNPAD